MATVLATLTSFNGYHLIAWGSLLGTQLYQSFVMTKVCHLYLPLPQFTSLQRRVFPVYFRVGTALAVATAVTYPSGSIFALTLNGVDFVLLGLTLVMSGMNLVVYGPKTSDAMVKRAHQETREQLQKGATGVTMSKEMHSANRAFSRNHALSIHLNLIAIICTILYGLKLGTRIV